MFSAHTLRAGRGKCTIAGLLTTFTTLRLERVGLRKTAIKQLGWASSCLSEWKTQLSQPSIKASTMRVNLAHLQRMRAAEEMVARVLSAGDDSTVDEDYI